MTFHFIQVLLLVGLINAGILFLVFPRLPIRNKWSLIYLGSLLILIALLFVSFGLLPRLRRYLEWLHLIRIPVGFFIGPVFYLWTKTLNTESSGLTSQALFHFIPGAVEVLIVASIWIYIGVTQPLNRVELLYHPGFTLVYDGLLLVYTTVYLILAGREYTKREIPAKMGALYQSVFYGMGGLLTLWTLFYALEILQYPRPLCSRYYSPLCLILLTFYLVLGYRILINPKKMNGPRNPKSRQLMESDLIQVYQRIQEAIIQQKLYLNPELSSSDISELLEVPAYLVPKVIRIGGEESLADFLNRLRIESFLQKMDQGQDKTRTFYSMAQESGFKSRATFYRVFKKYTGQTPGAFKSNRN